MQDEFETSLQKLSLTLGKQLLTYEPLAGGKNNRLFKVGASDGSSYVAKFYFKHPNDTRDRLCTEYRAFEFLWENHIRQIPQPLACLPKEGCAAYSYIEGASIEPKNISKSDIEQALKFCIALKDLSKLPQAGKLGSASEASFSPSELCKIIDKRLLILGAASSAGGPLSSELGAFLNFRLLTSFEALKSQASSWKEEIAISQRTLSPSDFGFHNALKTAEGIWIFQDFEYFGWDDPAKLISDFMLHPAMDLCEQLREHFKARSLQAYADDPFLKERLDLVFPLYVIKWCCIILNEFVPEFRARRNYAAAKLEGEALELTLRRQLEKAKKLLDRFCPLH